MASGAAEGAGEASSGRIAGAGQVMEHYLLDELIKYSESGMYPLHMPGHKRQIKHFSDPFSIDVTEIEGFDNLHHPEGILLEAQQRAAALYGAEETWFLINGSTCGVLAAVSAVTRRGGSILMARSSHKAAAHAAVIKDLNVSWIYPQMDEKRGIWKSICPEQVQEQLEGQESAVQAVLITSPTYDGVVSDIRSIAEIVHRAGAILIVDEAHGAHFAMHPYFPESAVSCGADLVIQSLHKTMPSLTQTALLHVNGPRVDRKRLQDYLDIYQSSSPSYVLMAGMDACIHMMETQGPELFDTFTDRLRQIRRQLGKMRTLHLVSGDEPELSAYAFDPSKVLISLENCPMSGADLGRILRSQYQLEPEMEAEEYVTLILTAADTKEGFDRLQDALLQIDARLTAEREQEAADKNHTVQNTKAAHIPVIRPRQRKRLCEAFECRYENVALKRSCGRVAAESVWLYPPGIPLVVPGEEIPAELPELLERYRKMGLHIQGMADYTGETIRCMPENGEKTQQLNAAESSGEE